MLGNSYKTLAVAYLNRIELCVVLCIFDQKLVPLIRRHVQSCTCKETGESNLGEAAININGHGQLQLIVLTLVRDKYRLRVNTLVTESKTTPIRIVLLRWRLHILDRR